ncbi:LysM peptidoglycan-binding domain-containing protein [Granulosicoccus antarcticus]|uniref:LysM domain-containing protein n=1 Tax=Granulosicoccus antarcticus IMCC3135 TaxID=1192854 RepID=A0A2Z2NYQ5_9GAMM|nr:LysM peptidoglycan-binding domain-containing protein [Granulosicoccus antarcticus]ASJ76459.1 hypothetical protein IMCC3135_32065 [Granulosicoccus antarcticus IMCC3135]
MSNSIPALFKTSLVAAAIVSLSACSTTPGKEDTGLSRVGAGILTAGRTTADVTGRAWDKTTYLLGFSDEDTEAQADETQISQAGAGETRPGQELSDEGLLMDAEEVTLLEGNGTSSRDTTIRPIVIHSATPNRRARDQIPSVTPRVETNQAATIETPINDDVGELAESDIIPQPEASSELATTLPESAPAIEDMVHTVGSSETLWDIAKQTTGDATNWHILADINNLGPNASVYAGQKLIIPADMIKPSLNQTAALETSVQDSVPEQIYVDTQNLSGAISEETAAKPQLEVPASAASDAEKPTQVSAKAFKLNPGETLWDFAKRTTGDATNWQAIAGQNEFSAEQAAVVRTGQTIYVPENLIKSDLESAIITATPELETAVNVTSSVEDEVLETVETAANITPAQPSTTIAKSEALRTLTISSKPSKVDVAGETELLDANADLLSESIASVKPDQAIKIVEANFQSEETTSLTTQATDALKSVTPEPDTQSSPDQIMVSGTYYPKAIYNNADFSSSLLMRVSPGTTLQVAKSMGNWYQVKTSKGLGYVHQRDIK